MSSEKFLKCWAITLGNEGGFTIDNGGQTRWGITEAVARRAGYIGEMRDLPEPTAQTIAEALYWKPFGCEQLPLPVAFQVFDTAYNGGHPVQWLQQLSGATVDGQIGPKTIAAVSAMNPWQVVALFNALRLEYLASLKQPIYANGRMSRIATNLRKGDLA